MHRKTIRTRGMLETNDNKVTWHTHAKRDVRWRNVKTATVLCCSRPERHVLFRERQSSCVIEEIRKWSWFLKQQPSCVMMLLSILLRYLFSTCPYTKSIRECVTLRYYGSAFEFVDARKCNTETSSCYYSPRRWSCWWRHHQQEQQQACLAILLSLLLLIPPLVVLTILLLQASVLFHQFDAWF